MPLSSRRKTKKRSMRIISSSQIGSHASLRPRCHLPLPGFIISPAVFYSVHLPLKSGTTWYYACLCHTRDNIKKLILDCSSDPKRNIKYGDYQRLTQKFLQFYSANAFSWRVIHTANASCKTQLDRNNSSNL
jgi:hypothetical protein